MFKYDPQRHRCIDDIIKDFFYEFGIAPGSFEKESGSLQWFAFNISIRSARDHYIPELSQAIREFVMDNIEWKGRSLIESSRSASREEIEKEISIALSNPRGGQ